MELTKLTTYSSNLMNTLFSAIMRIDYKSLSRYIIQINQMSQLETILIEASNCLKEILNYRLFALAVENEGAIDVWVDPSVFKEKIIPVIRNDFGSTGPFNIHPLDKINPSKYPAHHFNRSKIVSHTVQNDTCMIKLYVIPERRMFQYHKDILTVIINTLGVAISNYILIKKLKNDAVIDTLTQCYNRRELNRLLDRNIANANRYGKALSVIMFDLDHFKLINDTYGHPAGDYVLKSISEIIRHKIRKGDLLARYGGEEFVIILPDTGKSKAIEMAERLRHTIENSPVTTPRGKTIRITASFGVTSLKQASDDRNTLIAAVDFMLYNAKKTGRNTVISN